MDCNVIGDLLPLYADDACSEESRAVVEEHLQECPECSRMLCRLRETEIENSLQLEKDSVIRYGLRRFRRRSAAVGSAVSGGLLIPILVCVLLSMAAGPAVDWVSVVIAALCVIASLTVVPIIMPEDKAFWMFCAFCASLLLLEGVTCLYAHSDWFWISSSATLFGLAVVFLPFVIRARPVKKLIGNSNKLLIVLGIDTALFINMLSMVSSGGRLTLNSLLFTVVVIVGIGAVILGIVRKKARN